MSLLAFFRLYWFAILIGLKQMFGQYGISPLADILKEAVDPERKGKAIKITKRISAAIFSFLLITLLYRGNLEENFGFGSYNIANKELKEIINQKSVIASFEIRYAIYSL